MRNYILLALLLASVETGFAQSDSSKKERSYGKFELEYLNNSVFFGRADSIKTPYLGPVLGYYFSSGFFVQGSLSYLLRSGQNRIDVATVAAGYEFTKKDLYGEIEAEKNFYNTNSTNVKSEVQGTVEGYLQYDLHFIQPFLQAGVNIGKKSDYFLSVGMEHAFEIDSSRYEITPSVSLNGSTRNFYGSYYNARHLKNKNIKTSASVPDASQFKMMDVELSLPIKYNWKKLTLGVTPYYAIPMNPATVIITVKLPSGGTVTKTVTEKTENQFYFSLYGSLKF
jgi:hypothetical protein